MIVVLLSIDDMTNRRWMACSEPIRLAIKAGRKDDELTVVNVGGVYG